ncbi:hypothetical protein B0H11DRAFT_2174899 [Mycena galericulata]|nr:hypothetical protein B0H11DRAFT_2174899 [Mycena galericulata]
MVCEVFQVIINAFFLGPAKTNIIYTTTTLISGPTPNPQLGELFLLPPRHSRHGISNGTGDLTQSTLESWPDSTLCSATTGEWCVHTDSVAGIAKSTDALTWVQMVSIAGKVIATLSSHSGPYTTGGLGTGSECDDGCSGTTAIQTYTNTVIILDAADPTFGNTLVLSGGTTSSGLVSSQCGLVWSIARITIPAMV